MQNCESTKYATVPMETVGPIKFADPTINEVIVPLATFETPLWASTNRGAKVSRATNGIITTVTHENMTRSIVLQGNNAQELHKLVTELPQKIDILKNIASATSRYAELKEWHPQIVGNLLYLRLAINSKDAAGHNMTTLVAEKIIDWLLKEYSFLKYVSVSANCCTDKKVSAINGILGRGRYVIAELTIPHVLCNTILKTTPEKIVDLHIKKNLLGSILSGGIRTANAHFANVLLAFYLATGQDAANIVEGSQGIVHTELCAQGLYFSVTIPNIIVGTVGNGKNFPFVQHNLQQLGCLHGVSGTNATRLAILCAGTILCAELSLLAAQTNHGELMRSHLTIERKQV